MDMSGWNLQPDLATSNFCAPTNRAREAKRPEAVTTVAVKPKKHKHRLMFPAAYTLLLLAVSMYGILGSDMQALVKAMAVRCVDLLCNMPTGRTRAAAEGRETAHLHCCLSFMLQHTLSQRIRHHLFWQRME